LASISGERALTATVKLRLHWLQGQIARGAGFSLGIRREPPDGGYWPSSLCMQYDAGQEESMASLQIREMPPDVYEALAARAKAENRSMAQQAIVELRRLPELAVRESRKQALAELRERRRQSGLRELAIPAEQLIREDRER
jgi:hypothetical protein